MATISIDLGTFNSAAAYRMPDGEITLLQAYHGPTQQGKKLIPSFLKFYANGELDKYGEPAYDALGVVPELVVWGLKRLLGKSYHNAKNEFHRIKYPIKEAEDGSISIPIGSKIYTPIELTAIFLKKIKEDCESSAFNPIGSDINRVIITHPAYFDSSKTASVKEAALKAGFEEVELISEPEAAALAYVALADKEIVDFSSRPFIMVIDWGAGTLDIVLCRFSVNEKGNPVVENAYAPYGDTNLGGIDMDDALLKKAKNIYGLTNIDAVTESNLRAQIEKKKIALSNRPWTQGFFGVGSESYSLNFVRSAKDLREGEDIKKWIVLEEAISDILKKFKDNLLYALDKDGLSPDIVDGLILVGGPMYMPCVKNAIMEIFQENEKVITQLGLFEQKFPVSPLEAVVRGAIDYIEDKGKKLAYTYGFLIQFPPLDGQEVKEITIQVNTTIAGDKIVKEGKEFTCAVGRSIGISLYRKVSTTEGEKHFRKGDYRFTATAMPGKIPTYKPIIEIDSSGSICTLKMVDKFSQDPLELIFKNEGEDPIPPPEPFVIITREDMKAECIAAGMTGEEAEKEVDKREQEITTIFLEGEIPAERVNEVIKKSLILIQFVESQKRPERPLKKDTLKYYEKLTQNVGNLVPDQPINKGGGMAAFSEADKNAMLLENRLRNIEGFQI